MIFQRPWNLATTLFFSPLTCHKCIYLFYRYHQLCTVCIKNPTWIFISITTNYYSLSAHKNACAMCIRPFFQNVLPQRGWLGGRKMVLQRVHLVVSSDWIMNIGLPKYDSVPQHDVVVRGRPAHTARGIFLQPGRRKEEEIGGRGRKSEREGAEYFNSSLYFSHVHTFLLIYRSEKTCFMFVIICWLKISSWTKSAVNVYLW